MEETTIIEQKTEPTETQTEQPNEQPKAWESKSDNSATDALNKRIADLSTPKEVYQEAVNKSQTTNSFSSQTEQPKQTGQTTSETTTATISNDAAMQTAKTIVRTENFLIPFVADTFFGLNSDYIKANDKEFKELQEAWFEELKNHPEFKMPSWVTLVVAHLAIYAYKIGMAIKAKKEAEKTIQAVNQWQQHNTNAEQAAPTAPEQQPITQNVPPVYEPQKHKCALPGCNEMIPLKKKYCGTSHRSIHQNQIRKAKKM